LRKDSDWGETIAVRDVDQEPEVPRRQSSPPPSNPRLSPVLNPLLAQQMGRWAHVYYTAPMEQREAAVEQLVRELEAESAMIGGVASAPASSAAEANGQLSHEVEAASAVQNAEPIESQEFAIPSEIREPLAEGALIAEPACETPMAASDASLAPWITQREPDLHDMSAPQPPVAQVEVPEVELPRAAVSQVQVPQIQVSQIEASQPEPALRQAIASDLPDTDLSDNHFPKDENNSGIAIAPWTSKAWRALPRGRFVAASLVVAAGVLLWVAPRIAPRITTRSATPKSAAPVSTAPVSTTAKEPVASSEAVSSTAQQPLTQPAAQSHPEQVSTIAGSGEVSSLQHSLPSVAPSPRPAGTPAALSANLATNSAANTFEKLGDKKEEDPELTMGLRYLHGDGVERDSEAAAHHLWKAVGKQNASALLELAGLYAKGDGVAQDCDQARVLILAAARQAASPVKQKRVEAARETLQTSGCE
jgi:hypothetical protein